MRKVARIFANPATIGLGAIAIFGGLRGIFDPATSPVALEWPRAVSIAWSLLYMSGGLMMTWGNVAHRANVESAGWTAFSGGAVLSALATVSLLNDSILASIYGIAVLSILAFVGLIKLFLLRRGYRLVWVAPPEEEV